MLFRSRGRGLLRGFLELRRPWVFSPEARRGSQGASRAAPGKSGLHARGEGERQSLGLGRSLEEENGYPLQYSCLENSVDRRAWWAVVHEVAKSWTRLSDFHFASLEQMAFLCLQMWVLR